MTRHFEEVREGYKPRSIRVLFVGESRPASGRFFYIPDDGKALRHYTEQAFRAVFGQVAAGGAFLGFFKECHVYLDDLCLSPVTDLDRAGREEARQRAIKSFAERLRQHDPRAIVITVKSVVEEVDEAITLADLTDVPVFSVPSPSMGRHREYVRRLSHVLRELRDRGILTAP